MAENKTKKGIVSLPSGVQYRVIEDGNGAKHPTSQSEVTVHYRGTFPDGPYGEREQCAHRQAARENERRRRRKLGESEAGLPDPGARPGE